MNTKNVSNVSTGGVILDPPVQPRNRTRRFTFTLNNYTEPELEALKNVSNVYTCSMIIGAEICPKTNTPHLQGYIEFKRQVDFSVLKKLCPRAHWEKARGNRTQNEKYCSKENNIIINTLPPSKAKLLDQKKLRIIKNEYNNVTWKPWQQKVIDIIQGPKNSRTIHWIWEPDGNTGKSFVSKFIYCKYTSINGDGKKADIAYKIRDWQKENDEADPDIILIDCPRDSLEYLNYSMLEKFKDGLFSSPKYESCDILFEYIPHVFVFANEEPDYSKVSMDRWNVIKI